MLDNLPPSLQPQREVLKQCLEAMHAAEPLREVYLFGSHARGEAGPDSDVDLCLVADGAVVQSEAMGNFFDALRGIWPRPPFSLIPISPKRLLEKKECGDHFFATVLDEGLIVASQN